MLVVIAVKDFRMGESAKGCYKYIHKVTHTIYVYKIKILTKKIGVK